MCLQAANLRLWHKRTQGNKKDKKDRLDELFNFSNVYC